MSTRQLPPDWEAHDRNHPDLWKLLPRWILDTAIARLVDEAWDNRERELTERIQAGLPEDLQRSFTELCNGWALVSSAYLDVAIALWPHILRLYRDPETILTEAITAAGLETWEPPYGLKQLLEGRYGQA